MNQAVVMGPLEWSGKRTLRLIAVAAAALLAAAVFVIETRPMALTLRGDDARLTSRGRQALAVYNLRAAPVLEYEGAPGAGLTIRISGARLNPATRKALIERNVAVPNVKGGQFQWQGKPAVDRRISVRIANGRQAPDAGLMIRSSESGVPVELHLLTVQTALSGQIDMPSGSRAEMTFAGADLGDPVVGGPIRFEIPPGESMVLSFDSQAALDRSALHLGNPIQSGGSEAGLAVGRAEVGDINSNLSYPRLDPLVQGVCGARPGWLLLTKPKPNAADCALGELVASELRIEPSSAGLTLDGSGFIIARGGTRIAGLWSALANPLIALLIGALVLAIAWPLWRLRTGRNL